MNKRWLAGLTTHQYKKLPVTMKMWLQFNVMPWTSGHHSVWMQFNVMPRTHLSHGMTYQVSYILLLLWTLSNGSSRPTFLICFDIMSLRLQFNLFLYIKKWKFYCAGRHFIIIVTHYKFLLYCIALYWCIIIHLSWNWTQCIHRFLLQIQNTRLLMLALFYCQWAASRY